MKNGVILIAFAALCLVPSFSYPLDEQASIFDLSEIVSALEVLETTDEEKNAMPDKSFLVSHNKIISKRFARFNGNDNLSKGYIDGSGSVNSDAGKIDHTAFRASDFIPAYQRSSNNSFRLQTDRDDRNRSFVKGFDSSEQVLPHEGDLPRDLVSNVSIDFRSDREAARRSAREFFNEPANANTLVSIGAALLTSLAIHELGHYAVADYAGASDNKMDFFTKEDGKLLLGSSTVSAIEDKSVLPYTMGGEFFADLTFEHALREYRKKPSAFNKALLIGGGADFLLYSLYAFYLAEDHSHYDPITVSEETGISRDVLFSVVLAKTLINAYRVYSGEDRIVPYFTVDRDSAVLNVAIPFEIDSLIPLKEENLLESYASADSL